MSEEATTTTTRIWKCGCGKVQMKLTGEPLAVSNCHCHSCVSASKFIDEKHGDHKDHISAIVKQGGGSAVAMFKPNQVETITSDISPEMFGCVKVGPKGKSVRKYVKCCGTQFGVAHPAFWGLNRNAMSENDNDNVKYVPTAAPMNAMKKYSFDPDSVPEPSVNMVKAGDMFTFMGLMLNPFGQRINKDVLASVTLDDDVAEEVPITWE